MLQNVGQSERTFLTTCWPVSTATASPEPGPKVGRYQQDYRRLERSPWLARTRVGGAPKRPQRRPLRKSDKRRETRRAPDLRGPDLPDDLLTGQHGDDTEDGGDLLTGQGQEGGDQGHDGLGAAMTRAGWMFFMRCSWWRGGSPDGRDVGAGRRGSRGWVLSGRLLGRRTRFLSGGAGRPRRRGGDSPPGHRRLTGPGIPQAVAGGCELGLAGPRSVTG